MPRSSSQPAPASKNVAFDLESKSSQVSSPDTRQHQGRGETGRGYEAEDDSESTLDGRDKRYPTHHPISETESDPEKSARRRSHRRRRHHPDDQHRSRDDDDDDRHHHHHRSSHHSSKNHHPSTRQGRPRSPTGSDATVELPDRFDTEGRKKSERGDDAVADILEDIISGKGPGGKYLKKLFGSGGGATDDDGDHDSAARKRRR